MIDEAIDGVEQALEYLAHLKKTTQCRPEYVPIYALWQAKEDAYKEVLNLLSMLAGKDRPYPNTPWDWKE